MTPIKCSKGIYYFPDYVLARQYAFDHNYPATRIRSYLKGWAIQLRISGPYVGPTE